MKLTNFVLIFSIIALTLFVVCDAKMNRLTEMSKKKLEYDKRIDSAVDDGIYQLVEFDSNREIKLNKDVAVEHFNQSLYSNFGVLGHSKLEEQLSLYIPIILIIDQDGFYIHYSDTYLVDGETYVNSKWTEKIHYAYEEGGYIYNFTLSDYVYLYDRATGKRHEGKYNDLKLNLNNTLLGDEAFDQLRRNTIILVIEKYMKEYINHHNKIAESFGITYQFSLPQIDKNEWYRTIDDISLLVLFQGYPFGTSGVDYYNRFAFGGARISKSRMYYIQKSQDDYRLYYHKDECPNLLDKNIAFYTKEECATYGAFPCPLCKP